MTRLGIEPNFSTSQQKNTLIVEARKAKTKKQNH